VSRGKKGKGRVSGPNVRLDPSARIAPKYDSTGVRTFPIADAKQMGVRVKDDCAEEHIQ